MIKRKVFLLVFVVISMISCDDTGVFDQYKTVSNTWEIDEEIEFSLPNLDSLKAYNLFINVRNTNDYQYSNLFIISEMKFPNGKIVKDTLEYTMAAPDGQWLGTGFSDVKESKLWYKEKVYFKESGEYTISLQHAMRKNGEINGVSSLEGITDVGFRIENVEKP
ncbi:gliding motility lipoprotein GldH [Aquimarina sp. 2201CG1-2-11]|uniref:gliding motility lipoprotein GldH n=1 Tax=Aquimarina discodermiae TaxID=3231043 RepID=UPI00346245A4